MKRIAAVVVLGLMAGSAQASFFGRDASNQAADCSVSGAGKCVSFYNETLGITILNDWYIGSSFWDGSASPSATSAQGIASTAGLNATSLSGWVLPTPDQYLSIHNEAGGSFAGLVAQFDRVQRVRYWTSEEATPERALTIFTGNFFPPITLSSTKTFDYLFVAVRSGDVCAENCNPVPVPATLALLGLGLAGMAARRKSASASR